MFLLPTFSIENLIAYFPLGHSAEPMLIALKNKIPELFIQSDPVETLWEHPCWGLTLNFHSINY